jgi:hypothetical protein
LPDLVEILTGKSLGNLKPNDTIRAHRLSNVSRALAVLKICAEQFGSLATSRLAGPEIVDGDKAAITNTLLVLAQTFTIKSVEEGEETGDSALLTWVRRMVAPYQGAAVADLSSGWRSGLPLCALLHRLRPDVVDYEACLVREASVNVELALHMASIYLDAPMLITPQDLLPPSPRVTNYIII